MSDVIPSGVFAKVDFYFRFYALDQLLHLSDKARQLSLQLVDEFFQ